MKTRTWTIVLLYPDYIADSFGQDTYLAYTEADDERTALLFTSHGSVPA